MTYARQDKATRGQTNEDDYAQAKRSEWTEAPRLKAQDDITVRSVGEHQVVIEAWSLADEAGN